MLILIFITENPLSHDRRNPARHSGLQCEVGSKRKLIVVCPSDLCCGVRNSTNQRPESLFFCVMTPENYILGVFWVLAGGRTETLY